MTAFYRETIKKRRKNASLSEAVVKIHKQPYNNKRRDHIELIKARKSTDYSKLDTLALKLQGGPFSNLYTDIIKYPEYIFNDEDLPKYKFSYGNSTSINNRQIYVINFKQKEGLDFLLKSSGNALLADEMGLGKSIQIISVILGNVKKNQLIVVPKSIVTQW